jgi:hypothetical protein
MAVEDGSILELCTRHVARKNNIAVFRQNPDQLNFPPESPSGPDWVVDQA